MADSIQLLNAICKKCGENAPFTVLKNNFYEEKIRENNCELIGGSDYYEPVCRKCLIEYEKNKESPSYIDIY